MWFKIDLEGIRFSFRIKGYCHSTEQWETELELWKQRRKLDRECSVETEIEMLNKSGFKAVKCVYTFQKFSVIVAVK